MTGPTPPPGVNTVIRVTAIAQRYQWAFTTSGNTYSFTNGARTVTVTFSGLPNWNVNSATLPDGTTTTNVDQICAAFEPIPVKMTPPRTMPPGAV